MGHHVLIHIPPGHKEASSVKVPASIVVPVVCLGLLSLAFLGYFAFDYLSLKHLQREHHTLQAEYRQMRSEAELLTANIARMRGKLENVKLYTDRINKLVGLRVSTIQRATGIGPLTPLEEQVRRKNSLQNPNSTIFPEGLNPESLELGDAFKEVFTFDREAHNTSSNLRDALNNLSQKRTLLATLPTLLPVAGWVTSSFGNRVSPFTGQKVWHRGIDIAAPLGARVHAPADGVVVFSGKKSGFGNFIMIAHFDNGLVTKFGHNAENHVKIGQKVRKGDPIATVGLTGRTTGPHLHYEVWSNGRPVNPHKFILDQKIDLF